MRGHIVYEVAGRRYVLIPRDHRIKPRCYRCALGTQRRGEGFVPCPTDGRGNKVCEFGQGWTFMRIPPARKAEGSGFRVQEDDKARDKARDKETWRTA